MELRSTAFRQNGEIPSKYTCDSINISPELEFYHAPKETRSFTLILEDPDAPDKNWVHWVIYDIPVSTRQIPEDSVPEGKLGINDFQKITYGGPCPPSGKHMYLFRLFALDKMLNLEGGENIETIRKEMEDHILEEATLIGYYERF